MVREKSKLQLEHDEKRRQYMESRIIHDEFYGWLAEAIHITKSDIPFPLEQVRNSKDPYLNDLPLRKWAGMDGLVRHKAVSAGMQAWSLSDTVCVLKCYARKVAHD